MIAGKFCVDALIEFAVAGIAHIEGLVAAVIFRKLLLDDVGFNGDTEVIGLPGEVSGKMIVLIFFERGIAEITPQHGGHAEFVGLGKGMADFDNLAVSLIGSKI